MASYPTRRYVCPTILRCTTRFADVVFLSAPCPRQPASMIRNGLTFTTQIHTRSGLRAQWSATLGPGKDAFDFDGAGTFEVKSLEQFLKACQDPYFHEIILKDELNFLNKTQTVMATNTMGLNLDFVVGGKAVMGGTNSEMVLTE
jgi:hypothetical protein